MQVRAAVGNRWTPDGLAHGIYTEARGERAKHEAESGTPEPTDVEVIDVSEYHPPRIPSKKWRELIKKVWEVDPLICPHCGAEMKLITLIDDDEVIENKRLGTHK